ncbi:DUF317 domain-containing protein [Streptomyces sp. NPDC088789]|uniref:DUF317 domain-containing protein n=1 Tax=Streptomyces sp. NPDC088789 TaxID=3365899 RepID=UPI0037F876DE
MTAADSVEVSFVAPRHLAGGGDPGWITVPLHRAAGWSHGHDPLMPWVVLSSPDQKALLTLEPAADSPWWTLQHTADAGRPAWNATFGARTPAEIIAGATDALTHPRTVPTRTDPYEPLLEHGWLPSRDHDGLTSPDGFATVEHFTDDGTDTWHVTTAVGGDPEGRLWETRFSGTTPLPVITGFTRALADPAPLRRDPLQLSPIARSRARITVREIPAAHIASALKDRIQQLATAPDPPHTPPAPRARPYHPRSR